MRTIVVAVLLALAPSCKDQPSKLEPPASTPPKKTTKPLAKADFERLSKIEVPGYTLDVRAVGDQILELRQKTQDHPRMWAVVTIKPCFECLPMDLAKWKAKEAEIRALNLEVLKDANDIDWEMGETELDGQKMIYTYQVGISSRNAAGGVEFSFTNNYYLYFNDGVNEIRVAAMYKDDAAPKAELKTRAPKQKLRALALSFMDVYTHAW